MRISRGAGFALASALLFGASTPLAKLLGGQMHPVLLAGLLYVGSGTGLGLFRLVRREGRIPSRRELPWLGGAVLFGGALAPVLLMTGLGSTPAASASLLLNLEGVLTALLAWFVFHENFDSRIAAGMALIVAGGLVLSFQPGGSYGVSIGALAVVAACLCWAIDNNMTQKVSGADAVTIAATKGLVAGGVNVAIAFAVGAAALPRLSVVAAALLLGFVGYGLSLALFVVALRHLGAARTGAYFSVAPFLGVALSLVLLHERAGARLIVAGLLMIAGVWLHLTERHEHAHRHEALAHAHPHIHDAHHQHEHAAGTDAGEPHTHAHVHAPLVHSHPHYPDLHHRHRH